MLPTMPKLDELKKEKEKKTLPSSLPTLPKEVIDEPKQELAPLEYGVELERRPSGKLKMPKSQYDDNGDPILTIPNLDDLKLAEELDKFFD